MHCSAECNNNSDIKIQQTVWAINHLAF